MATRTIHQSDGSPLDATFEVQLTAAGVAIVIESRGGTRGEPAARNLDYGRGFELVLKRLQRRGAAITDALVDSRATQHLPPEERRLQVLGKPYPIAIDDAADLQRRIGAAQARVGREPGAQGSGNRTKRVRLVLAFAGPPPSLAALEADIAGRLALADAVSLPATGDARRLIASTADSVLGRPYTNIGRLPASERREPFEVDPDKVDRGNQAHAATQDALADFLRNSGFAPHAQGEPGFDLAWATSNALFVAEVKSITAANEEKQLRLGLGQVLRYRQAMSAGEKRVVAVLVAERMPTDDSWIALCSGLGVMLIWPGNFDVLLASPTN